MTVEQNLFFYSRVYGIKKFKDIIYDLVKKLKMTDLMKKITDLFSWTKN